MAAAATELVPVGAEFLPSCDLSGAREAGQWLWSRNCWLTEQQIKVQCGHCAEVQPTLMSLPLEISESLWVSLWEGMFQVEETSSTVPWLIQDSGSPYIWRTSGYHRKKMDLQSPQFESSSAINAYVSLSLCNKSLPNTVSRLKRQQLLPKTSCR